MAKQVRNAKTFTTILYEYPPLSCVLFIHVDKTQVKATLGDVSTSKVVMLKYYIQDRTLWSFSVGGKLCFLAEEYGSLWEKVHATDCPLGLGKIQCCDLGSLSVKKAWQCLATLPGCCVNLLNIHKAPWKWRGLHKSLVLFTQQTFSPENKVVNGTIVLLVERVQKFPFTTSRSSCGWLYGLSVLTPSSFQNSSTIDYPGMKSCTVRDGRITASHHIGQSCVASDFTCTFSLRQRGTIAEAAATWISNAAAIEQQLSSSTTLTNFPSLWILTTGAGAGGIIIIALLSFFLSEFLSQEKPALWIRWCTG